MNWTASHYTFDYRLKTTALCNAKCGHSGWIGSPTSPNLTSALDGAKGPARPVSRHVIRLPCLIRLCVNAVFTLPHAVVHTSQFKRDNSPASSNSDSLRPHCRSSSKHRPIFTSLNPSRQVAGLLASLVVGLQCPHAR